jgi:hypothetical protein
MTNPLPVPVEFDLPGEQWRVIPDLAEYGLEEAAFAAARTGLGDDYLPMIVISGGWWPAQSTAEDAAARALVAFADEVGGPVEVRHRQEREEGAGGMAQMLEATLTRGEQSVILDQIQIIDRMSVEGRAPEEGEEAPPWAGFVYRLTALREQVPVVAPEFEAMLRTIRFADGA